MKFNFLISQSRCNQWRNSSVKATRKRYVCILLSKLRSGSVVYACVFLPPLIWPYRCYILQARYSMYSVVCSRCGSSYSSSSIHHRLLMIVRLSSIFWRRTFLELFDLSSQRQGRTLGGCGVCDTPQLLWNMCKKSAPKPVWDEKSRYIYKRIYTVQTNNTNHIMLAANNELRALLVNKSCRTNWKAKILKSSSLNSWNTIPSKRLTFIFIQWWKKYG